MDLNKIDVAVLCGGEGKRLRPEIGQSQKVLAQVEDAPFLNIILIYLKHQGFRKVILCTGYKAEDVEGYYKENTFDLDIEFSREDEPLGTGGGLKNSEGCIQSSPFLVLNGDSFCPIQYQSFCDFHQQRQALASIAVTRVDEQKNFGSVEFDKKQRIVAFREKSDQSDNAFINAGIYCFKKEIFSFMPESSKFSLEYDFFPSLIGKGFYGFPVEEEFIDIGTPERYKLAQKYLKSRKS